MFDINALRGQTYATIRSAFNTSSEILEEKGSMANCNVTGILTRVIQDVGRFSERWSSDALYQLDHVRDIADKAFDLDGRPFDEIFAFGIRRDGVDHGDYIMKNLVKDLNPYQPYIYPEKYYRRILAIRCRAGYDPDLHSVQVSFSLRNITNSFHGVEPADQTGSARNAGLAELPFESMESPQVQERYALDQEDVRKAKEEGFKRFGYARLDPGQLEKEGTDPGAVCFEIRGYYGGIVPEDQDKGVPVCRVYSMIGFAVCWLGEYYSLYHGAREAVEEVKAIARDEAGGAL